ncbi:GHMP kinase [Fundidesulfovibrio soli]|uniref:GHMP family kinase ATP-binding protein n=1 Tax=Fundidesulfovibrio soli TaxID=2922716 RepID=UPI001FAF37FF|nr:GHMP kinase [Fundidesulfovibrio soli]
MKFYRSRAPLRLGLGGGGTDIPEYSSLHGGAILNATINRYAHATIEPCDKGAISFCSMDRCISSTFDCAPQLAVTPEHKLAIGVYNRIVRDYAHAPLSFKLTTAVDAPPGSGLGSSSTLVVAIIGAFCEWLQIPLGEYEIAQLAFDIERIDLGLSGGKQDQFAATFGGFNFMEFETNGNVLVNPLRVKQDTLRELEHNLLLVGTGVSRESAQIIDTQKGIMAEGDEQKLSALHEVKRAAYDMKRAVLTGDLDTLGRILRMSWESKKRTSDRISNPWLDSIISTSLDAGALGAKISGAGGGGYMMLYCPGVARYDVVKSLQAFDVTCLNVQFVEHGLVTWA